MGNIHPNGVFDILTQYLVLELCIFRPRQHISNDIFSTLYMGVSNVNVCFGSFHPYVTGSCT